MRLLRLLRFIAAVAGLASLATIAISLYAFIWGGGSVWGKVAATAFLTMVISAGAFTTTNELLEE